MINFEKFNIQSSPVCKKRDYLFLDQIERYNKVKFYFLFAVMHNLFPFSHCNATSLGFTEYKYKQGIVELSQLNTTELILQLSNILFPDLALWKEKAKQLQIQEKVHDHQICFKRENQRQRLQGPSYG